MQISKEQNHNHTFGYTASLASDFFSWTPIIIACIIFKIHPGDHWGLLKSQGSHPEESHHLFTPFHRISYIVHIVCKAGGELLCFCISWNGQGLMVQTNEPTHLRDLKQHRFVSSSCYTSVVHWLAVLLINHTPHGPRLMGQPPPGVLKITAGHVQIRAKSCTYGYRRDMCHFCSHFIDQ